ncbi:MAG: hypothetical protein J2P45_08540 [Candidatus Dormibacteraeota bacterium]|nr:hypothetical protein [Candidatus Dormibacteraeota bacterium]
MESGSKRVFACAFDWPGWCRSGKGEEAALEALATYAQRYAVVAAEAEVSFPPEAAADFEVLDRITGSKNADFGALGAPPARDAEPISPEEAGRQASLLAGAWRVFDRVVAGAPPELRKGPRGGGRDRDKIVTHVLEAEAGYGSRIGLRLGPVEPGDGASLRRHREAILDRLGAAYQPVGKGWPLPYAFRRFTWHVLDHAWEIEDRIPQE